METRRARTRMSWSALHSTGVTRKRRIWEPRGPGCSQAKTTGILAATEVKLSGSGEADLTSNTLQSESQTQRNGQNTTAEHALQCLGFVPDHPSEGKAEVWGKREGTV